MANLELRFFLFFTGVVFTCIMVTFFPLKTGADFVVWSSHERKFSGKEFGAMRIQTSCWLKSTTTNTTITATTTTTMTAQGRLSFAVKIRFNGDLHL